MKNLFKITTLLTLTLATLALTGCEGENPLTVTPAIPDQVIDTAPPAIPTGLSAAVSDQSVKISWDANVLDEDLFGFMVYRVVWGTRYAMLDFPLRETQWLDDHPVNMACTYVVTALDESGNESAWAAVNFLGMDEESDIRMEF